tara:strand:- start:370 stop:618 length:249 start_codon:yes stop_codon:yes gene_type:complete
MKFYTSYIIFFIITFNLNLNHRNQQEKILSSDLNEVKYSGFLQSQGKVLATENIILSCKFKSMNRKSSKSLELKEKVSKRKI